MVRTWVQTEERDAMRPKIESSGNGKGNMDK